MDPLGLRWQSQLLWIKLSFSMAQMLLLPDPRPLDQRLGRDFFLSAPECPGVYLMRDAQDKILYVGKAKDLRQRLGHYRLANPDRMLRRHLRMVNQVSRIELQFCANESAALQQEAKLIRSLKPKFNRAGVWPGRPKFIAWRVDSERLEITVVETPAAGWHRFGPLGGGAPQLQQSLLRLLWLALHPERPLSELPAGWVRGEAMAPATLTGTGLVGSMMAALERFFWQDTVDFISWLAETLSPRTHLFERGFIELDLESLQEFAARQKPGERRRRQLALL